MSIFKQSVSDYLAINISSTRSPRSVAKAYQQYLNDKTKIIADFLTMVSEAVLIEDIEEGVQARGTVQTKIDDILNEYGYSADRAVIGSEGEVISLGDLMTSMTNVDENIMVKDFISNDMVDPKLVLDGLVDSFQSSKIFESAFAIIDVQGEQARASISDIDTRVRALGLELTSNASSVLTNVGDIMSDGMSGVIGKISSLVSMMGLNSSSLDDDDDSVIVVPDFSQEGFEGKSPFGAMLNDVNIDIKSPVPAIVSGVKAAGRVISGFFKKTKNLVAKGFESAKNWVDDTFVHPIDFVILNKDSSSHMLDQPIAGGVSFTFEQIEHYGYLETVGIDQHKNNVSQHLKDMKIGSMISTYTPFAVINFVRDSSVDYRLLVHLIPTSPITQEFRYVDQIAPKYGAMDPRTSIIGAFPEAGESFLDLYRNFVIDSGAHSFNKQADDDIYYLRSLWASAYRLSLLTGMNNLAIVRKDNFGHWNDASLEDVESVLIPNANLVTANYAKAVGGYLFDQAYDDNWELSSNLGWLDFDAPEFKKAMSNETLTEDVTNKDFMDSLDRMIANNDNGELHFIASMVLLSAANQYDIMNELFIEEGTIPAFIPTIRENEYQIPMYSINSDSKNGGKVAKVFKGVIITAIVAVVAIYSVKAVMTIKKSITMKSFQLTGIQRKLENMDPDDPNYAIAYKKFIKSRKKFNKQNKFLGMIGLGARKNASSVFSGDFDLETFIPSNKSIEDLIK